MIRALHLFLMTFLTGAQLFTALWVTRTALRRSPNVVQITLQQSLLLDKAVAVIIPLLFLSGSLLVAPYGWHHDTPWILAAYLGLSLISVLWWLQARCKWQALQGHAFQLKPFMWLNGSIAFILLISIKDAITKHSWF